MHIYEKNNNLYPSVTTIVGYFKDKPSFEALQKWANFMGFNHKSYATELDKKAKFGTYVHALLAHELASSPIEDNLTDGMLATDINNAHLALESFRQFQSENCLMSNNTVFSEETIISEKLGYAGTVDWVGMYKNKLFLIDFKTSHSVHDSMKLQLAGYRQLLKEERNINIESSAILIINPNKVTENDISMDELDCAYEKFQKMFELFKLYNIDMNGKNIEFIK